MRGGVPNNPGRSPIRKPTTSPAAGRQPRNRTHSPKPNNRSRAISPKRTQTEPMKQSFGAKRATSPKRSSAPVRVTPSIMESITEGLLGTVYYDNAKFEAAVKRCIPAEFMLIASQDDNSQAQEDYFAMDHFKLTKHVPKYVAKSNAGSCATSALLQIMHENPHKLVAKNLQRGEEPLNVLEVSQRIKTLVKDATKLDARPTISSSRPLGPPRKEKGDYAPFYIVPRNKIGVRRALLIGVVTGQGPDLKGPPNDVANIQGFLEKHCGFKREHIIVLQDYWNGTGATQPTKKNILTGFQKLVRLSRPGDVNFIQFTGHG